MSISGENLFCNKNNLGNEASVETFMLSRLLKKLGYKDSQIHTKEQIDQLTVSAGRRHAPYRPDYVMTYRRKPRWVLDAKSTIENIDDYVGQCQSYCMLLNARQNENPVRYFMLSNGLRTSVYKWDNEKPVLELSFEDFVEDSRKWDKLRELLSQGSAALTNDRQDTADSGGKITLVRMSPGSVNKAFAAAHEYIYKHEQLSYGAAFMEFVKIVFLKMNSDKAAHRNPEATFNDRGDLVLPTQDVQFTVSWIESTEKQGVANPVNTVMFKHLVDDLEEQITKNKKKRIFDQNENIKLKAGTIKEIVKRFEEIDLYTIDEDLNGRMFETFLNATLRGKSLGQYFTPRSVVKMATGMADLHVSSDDGGHTDHVLDGCCGTGGYLINALAAMWRKVELNGSLSQQEKASRKKYIAEHNIWGVDAARDPKLARIARMNMFLHGDGGSRIYQLDTLDKSVTKNKETDDLELQSEKDEFKRAVFDGDFFDVVLTNPPFATEYKRSEETDKRILEKYDIAYSMNEKTGKKSLRANMRSSVLFMERYYDLLKEGGTLVTVIDDGVLGGDDYSFVRNWLRSHFLIRAVISLPGDAFQRSQARVKTSILVMEKRQKNVIQEQPPVFMWYCSHVGLDDPKRERVLPGDAQLVKDANDEVAKVTEAYSKFRQGDLDIARTNSVPATAIQGRMDVKAVLPRPGRNQSKWEQLGLPVFTLGQLATNVFDGKDVASYRSEDVISTLTASVNDQVQLARVRYDGILEKGDTIYTVDSSSATLYRIHKHDLVLSNINAVNGAIGIVPEELDGLVVTSEYTVLRPNAGMDVSALWTLLRSPVARADMILLSTGIGRTRISWKQIKELRLPVLDAKQVKELSSIIDELFTTDRRKRNLLSKLQGFITHDVPMSDNEAGQILAAFKPPR